MKHFLRSGRSLLWPLLVLSAAPAGFAACGDDTSSTAGAGGAGGSGEPPVRPGDICSTPQPPAVSLRFSPAQIFVTSGGASARKVKLVAQPDFCVDNTVTLTSDDPTLVAPKSGVVGLYKSEFEFEVGGTATPGRHTLTASVPRGDGTDATATLDVVVLEATPPTCEGTASDDALAGGETLAGTGKLRGATIGLQKGASDDQGPAFPWRVEPFAASIACSEVAVPSGFVALGPAITFGPEAQKFQREIPLTIPVNPALLPAFARLRHVQVLYSGPAFKAPRTVAVSDARFVEVDGQWALSFKAPRLGTYQAIVATDAGTKTRKRKIMHRAVMGVSMGGMGSSMFGLRHHDKFDVVAPLGGPASWSWLMRYIQQHHMAGFRPIAPGTTLDQIQQEPTPCMSASACAPDETCIGASTAGPGRCALLGKPEATYEHVQSFNHWRNELPGTGTGGSFPRRDYAQIFRDLSLLMGNPNGDNLTPGAEFLPPGVPPTDKSVRGERDTDECAITVEPLDDHPDKAGQDERWDNCPKERCANPLTLSEYYDAEFNPDGTFPVITFCDGAGKSESESPWANAWKASGNDFPMEVALAVDYNGNGVRDAMEPVIQSGHEPWRDVGEDGLASKDEPGYQVGVNDDPAGDDYDPQYNPGGRENNFRFDAGEPFDDVGMDGVTGTKQQPASGWAMPGDGYDVGEGDGVFNASRGLRRMWEHDPGAIVRGESTDVPGGPMNDDAFARLDVWTDGGLRDIFNFHVAAQHLSGSLAARGRPTSYYSDFSQLPGFDPAQPNQFAPSKAPWADIPGSVLLRYGMIDPTPESIENGNGQHVGTVPQVAYRLQSALYYIASRWPEPELRSLVKVSNDDPVEGAPVCEVDGSCTFEFTDSRGRRGPVSINLPPGYAHKEQQDRRYPVVYLLHGYGMTPEDLGAAIVFIGNWMNNGTDSMSTRLAKAIVVYVDGRCRVDESGKAECIKGNFFTDSARDDGSKAESWWLELMEHIDSSYRTMPPTEIDWSE